MAGHTRSSRDERRTAASWSGPTTAATTLSSNTCSRTTRQRTGVAASLCMMTMRGCIAVSPVSASLQQPSRQITATTTTQPRPTFTSGKAFTFRLQLVGCPEQYLDCKKLSAGTVICLERVANDLHNATTTPSSLVSLKSRLI